MVWLSELYQLPIIYNNWTCLQPESSVISLEATLKANVDEVTRISNGQKVPLHTATGIAQKLVTVYGIDPYIVMADFYRPVRNPRSLEDKVVQRRLAAMTELGGG